MERYDGPLAPCSHEDTLAREGADRVGRIREKLGEVQNDVPLESKKEKGKCN